MSANNQIIVAPYPGDMMQYAVWHDSCIDEPFDFSIEPLFVSNNLEDVLSRAADEDNGKNDPMGFGTEYGIHFIPKSAVKGYSTKMWDNDPDPEIAYRYLGIDGPDGEGDPSTNSVK